MQQYRISRLAETTLPSSGASAPVDAAATGKVISASCLSLLVVLLSITVGCSTSSERTQTGDGETPILGGCGSDCEDATVGGADTDSGSTAIGTDTDSGSTDSGTDAKIELPECQTQTEIQSSCLSSEVIIGQDVYYKVDKIDLLFVVDNSKSMEQEQEKLRAQIPRMIKVLTTGDKTPDNGVENKDYPPVKDLHLALVSADMGLPGLGPGDNPDSTGACDGTGDDGNFLNDPSEAIAAGMNCPGISGGGYPVFLEHIREESEDFSATLQRAEATAAAFGCVSTLGLTGCGFEMQLEAALKALWPSQIGNLTEAHQDLGITFLAGSQGRGDNDHINFLRGTPYHPTEADQPSLLAIIVVTDEEDCSAGLRGNLDFLSLNFAGGDRQDLNIRCHKDTVQDWGNKYPVSRYIDGFKALRPALSDLVVFAAIAGIPAGFIEDTDGNDDISPQERETYYDLILNHDSMQETPNPDTNNLNYSCVQDDDNDGEYETQAYPPRRITEVARGFGRNGVIRSICADDFTPAMDVIIAAISDKIGDVCLSRAYTRDSRGLIGCDVIWTMPLGRTCADYSYLNDPPLDRPQFDNNGRKRCVVEQIPVINPNTTDPAEALDFSHNNGLGWYYDDFSSDMQRTCTTTEQITTEQRISFSLSLGSSGQNEDPPSGVSIVLACLDQIAIWPDIYYAQNDSSGSSDTPTPRAGYSEQIELVDTPCEDESGEICPWPPVESGELFCNANSNLCVLRCRDDDDCPADWTCDDRQNQDSTYLIGRSYPVCINPICDLPEGAALDCGNSDVGEACMPLDYSPDGFSKTEIYIETNSPACETRICGVFGFEGDPREQPSDDLQEKIYCSCRCRAFDPDIPTCTCPDGFECSEDILSIAGPGLAGGYCVREGTL